MSQKRGIFTLINTRFLVFTQESCVDNTECRIKSDEFDDSFEAADMDGGGQISFDEFDELIRCLQFLNKQRHLIGELMKFTVKTAQFCELYSKTGAILC